MPGPLSRIRAILMCVCVCGVPTESSVSNQNPPLLLNATNISERMINDIWQWKVERVFGSYLLDSLKHSIWILHPIPKTTQPPRSQSRTGGLRTTYMISLYATGHGSTIAAVIISRAD